MARLLLDARLALFSLIQHRRRSAFLGSTIAIVTALTVLLNAFAAGIDHTLIESATALTTGHLNVGGFFKVTAGQAAPVVTEYARVHELISRALPEAAYTVTRGRGWANLVSDSASRQVALVGIEPQNESGLRSVLRVQSGHLDDLSAAGSVLLFASQADELQVRVGDAITIVAQTTRGVANTVDCRIAAVADDVGLLSRWNALVSSETLRSLYQLRSDVTGVVQIYLQDRKRDSVDALAERLRGELERAGYDLLSHDVRPFWLKLESVTREAWTGQRLDVTSWKDELSMMMWPLRALEGFSVALVFLLLAIVVVGIMNTLWIAIRERTREIGTLRTLGMQRGGVVRIFLWESFFLGLFAASLGALLGCLVALVINALKIEVLGSLQLFLLTNRLLLVVVPQSLLGVAALIIAVTTLAALYPALRAARLQPLDAMTRGG